MSDQPVKDWGNVRFRRSATAQSDATANRFWLGMAILVIGALVYPWYAYWVDSFLVRHDLEAAASALKQQSDAASQQMADSLATAQAQSQANAAVARAQSEAYAQRNRIALVRVMGASANGVQPVVLVQLGTAGIEEASDTICRQARYWLNRDVAGTTLRIQRARGNEPALDAGVVNCR